MKKGCLWLFRINIGDEILHNYIGIITTNQYFMESRSCFFVAQLQQFAPKTCEKEGITVSPTDVSFCCVKTIVIQQRLSKWMRSSGDDRGIPGYPANGMLCKAKYWPCLL